MRKRTITIPAKKAGCYGSNMNLICLVVASEGEGLVWVRVFEVLGHIFARNYTIIFLDNSNNHPNPKIHHRREIMISLRRIL